MQLRIKALSALAAILFVLTLTGCGKSPEEHLQQARGFMDKADYKSAIVELKTLLQEQPSNQEAHVLLGKAHFVSAAYADAEKELTKARSQGAADEQTLPLLAKTLLKRGQAGKVMALELSASGLSPQAQATFQAARAEAQLILGRRAEAEQTLAVGSEVDSTNPDLLVVKAKLAIADQQNAQAEKFIDTALQRDGKFIDALYLKASLLQQEKKPAEATRHYQQILAVDPGQFVAHLALSKIALEQGNVAAAEQALQSAEKSAGGVPMVKYARGLFELRRGRDKEANESLLYVLRVIPDHLPSILAQAMASYGMGNYEQSMQGAQKVLGQAPNNLVAAKILAASQIKKGDTAAALNTLAPLLKSHSDDAKFHLLAGEAHFQSGDYAKSMEFLDRAAALAPKNLLIKKRQAASHLARGESDQALADLEQASSLSDKPGRVDLALVMLHLSRQEFDQALKAIAELDKKLPGNPVTHNLRAAALLGKQDRAGARKALEQALAIQPGFHAAALNLGRMDLQDKQPDAARRRFEAILAMDKNNLQAMLALADLAAANKQEKDYVDWLEKAAKAHPQAISPRTTLVRHYLTRKQPQKALALAREAASANPDNPEAINLLGATQLASGEKANAIVTYTRLAEKTSQSPDALLHLAMAQLAEKNLAAARASLQKAVKLKPDHLPSLDTLLSLELADKKHDAALQVARQIQARQPKSPLGYEREGDIQVAQKRLPQAIKAYEQAMAKGVGSPLFIKLHRAQTLAGQAKQGEQRLNDWLKQHPNDNAVRTYTAEYYMVTGRNKDAIAHYQEILRLNPNNALALNNLANLYQRERDGRALTTAEQALKLVPDSPTVQDTLGWILVEQGQAPRGLELLRQAVARAPRLTAARYHQAVALARTGDKARARRELEQLLGEVPKFPEAEAAKTLLKSL